MDIHKEREQLVQKQFEQMQKPTLETREFWETTNKSSSTKKRIKNFLGEISNSLSEFRYDRKYGVTFPAYFRRYEMIFSKKCLLLSNE